MSVALQPARLTGAIATAPATLRFVGRYAAMPVVLAAVVVATLLHVRGSDLDSIEQRRLGMGYMWQATLQHVALTVVSTVLVLAVAIPLGVLFTRRGMRRAAPFAVAVFGIGQAVPSIGLLVLLTIVWTIGFWPAVVALVAYSMLPVLRNTMIGLSQVDEAVVESARGMGMSRRAVLTQIELPLAVPVILAGLRTALVINVGTAALAALTDAGGLGTIIVAGLVQNRPLVTVVGSILTAALALFVDYLGRIAGDLLRPNGL